MVIGSFVGGQPKRSGMIIIRKDWKDSGYVHPEEKRGWYDGQTIGDTTTLILGSTVDAPTRLGLKAVCV